MRWTKFGLVAGAIFLGFGLWVVSRGNRGLGEVLIAIVALTLLVAGGNWLNDWLGIKRKPQEFNRPDRSASETDER